MGRGAWVLRLGLCIALVGCGSASKPPPPPQEEPGTAPPPGDGTSAPDGSPPPTHGGTLPSDGGTPPTDGGTVPTDAGTPPPAASALEGTPTLAPAACVPVKDAAPPQQATACEVVAEYRNRPYSLRRGRYDAEGHLLEQRSFRPDGTLDSVETHTWASGHETLRRLESPRDASWSQTEWTYDAQGQLQERKDTASSTTDTTVYQYHYDASGRLASLLRFTDGLQDNTTIYQYTPAGAPESIDSTPHCDQSIALCERYVYRPNGGKLRLVARNDSSYWHQQDTYDSLGRLTHSSWNDFDEVGENTRDHDSAGRVTRLWEKRGVHSTYSESVTTSVYDTQGLLQLERFAEDAVVHPVQGKSAPNAQDVFTHARVTRRLSYLCGTSTVALEEWDSNEDGVPDARRTYERDAAGRLVHEEYSGVPDLDDGPVRSDFSYDCH